MRGPSRAPCRNGKKQFQKAVKIAILVSKAIAQVDIDNKEGDTPRGWQLDVANSLQKGIKYGAYRMLNTLSFQEVEPDLFARVRVACGVSMARYNATMCLQDGQTGSNLRFFGSSSHVRKSASSFFSSVDGQYVIKVCTSQEWRTLLQILPKYVERLEAAGEESLKMASNPNQKTTGFMKTLLPRYLGLYVLRNIRGEGSEMHVRVMLNVFGGAQQIHKRYNLKGSSRKASQEELSQTNSVRKDIDWVDTQQKLALCAADKQHFLAALAWDVRCLQSWNLMNYSLLVGIHNREPQVTKKYDSMPVVTIENPLMLAYIGIGDILTMYGTRKQSESFFKHQLCLGKNISCQHPKYYGERFFRFILDSVLAGTV
mmetsp:Transcript_66577/g.128839  ORF Transcript_66577/g.128839 Transcript_66577/m.128839 type:complete len:371 (-) Transcript_66577:171-1283(-)